MDTLDQRNNHDLFHPLIPTVNFVHISIIFKSELVYKNHIKKVKLFKWDINWSVFYKL